MKQTGNLLRLDDDQPKLSRRQFLKMSGAACVGAALSAVQSGSLIIPTNSKILSEIPPDALEMILTIARDAPMFQEAIGELMGLDLEFNVVAGAVRISELQGDTVGAVIGHTFSSSQRMGADLVITVDLVSRTLQMVQFVVGWSLLDTLEISSTIFDVRKPVYEEPRDIRDDGNSPPILIRPRAGQRWSYWRPDSPPIQPEDLVEVGWPPETPDSHYWYYDGCSDADWSLDQGLLIYRCTQVSEHHSDDLGQQRTLDLQYPE